MDKYISDIIAAKDLNTTLLAPKLELIDRWIICTDEEGLKIEIENRLEDFVLRPDPFYWTGVPKDNKTLEEFMKTFCSAGTTFLSNETGVLRPDPKCHPNDPPKTITAMGVDFSITLQPGQSIEYTINNYQNPLGQDISVLDWVDKYTWMFQATENVHVYLSDGYYILFTNKTSIVYLYNLYEPLRLNTSYSVHHIVEYPEFHLAQYGLKYPGDIGQGTKRNPRELLTFDLELFNEQSNKDFTKGYVSLPYMMTSSGMFVLTEMYIPVRKTEILDEDTRVVYNYLYKMNKDEYLKKHDDFVGDILNETPIQKG